MQLAVVCIDGLLNALEFDILTRQEFLQREKARLVFCLVVVPVLNLTLERGKLDGLIASARVGTIDDGVSRLNVEEVQLDRVVTVNVLIGEEEFLSQSEDNCFLDALFTERLLCIEPVHCTGRWREREGQRGKEKRRERERERGKEKGRERGREGERRE